MPSGVKQDEHILLRLVLGKLSPEGHRARGTRCKIGDLEVQMHHHLLPPSAPGHVGRT